MPLVDGMAVCVVKDDLGISTFKMNDDIDADNVIYAGTGSRAAFACWSNNKCSIKAIESAKAKDFYSGGEVKFINFSTNETNLNNSMPTAQLTIEQISRSILQRGFAMKIQAIPTGTPVLPFVAGTTKSPADNRPPIEEMEKLVSNGQLSATAPCDGMYNKWSEKNQHEFKSALSDMFGWNK
jgi:hypothetical protein